MPRYVFEAWRSASDGVVTLTTPEGIARLRHARRLGRRARLLWRIEAETYEEARAVHHLRMGFEPYRPNGEPARCGKCRSVYYPESSGECWKCGTVGHRRAPAAPKGPASGRPRAKGRRSGDNGRLARPGRQVKERE